MFVRNDAKEFRFCRSRCHKNFKMKRNPRRVAWTKAFRKAAGKEMVFDATLTFAARRQVPTRYNRDLVAKTLKAMDRVAEIRARRERVNYRRRMAGNRQRELEAARKLVDAEQPQFAGAELPANVEQISDEEEDELQSESEDAMSGVEEDKVPIAIPVKKRTAKQRK